MIRKLLTMLTVITLMSGCSVDEPFGTGKGNEETALQLLVPDTRMAMATRADSGEGVPSGDTYYDLAANEASISSLYLVAFYTEGEARKHYFADLGQTAPSKVNDIYAAYTLYLAPSDYDLYLFANITPGTDLLGRLKAEGTDADLENDVKRLKIGLDASGQPGKLPMSYSSIESVTIEKGKTKQVKAKLTFDVAKVRFTMLYNNAFGKNNFLNLKPDNNLTVKNLYKTCYAFPTAADKGSDAADVKNAYVTSAFCKWPVIDGEEFAEDEDLLLYLEKWRDLSYTSGNMNTSDPIGLLDPLDSFSFQTAKNENYKYAYQTVSYLPESLDKTESAATTLTINATKCKFEDNGATPADNAFDVIAGLKNGENYSLKRGHFYDIIGYVTPAGDIKYRLLEEIKWDPTPLNVSLAGTVYLDLGTTEIPSLSGAEPYYMSFNTNSPAISFESDKHESGKPYFSIAVDPNQEGMLVVSVNPACPESGTAVKGKGFYVQTGNIRKRVNVKTADFSEFLTISPSTRTLNVAQIINEDEYPVYFTWATNKKDLKLSVTDLVSFINDDAASINALTIMFQRQDDEGEWKDIFNAEARVRNQRYGSTLTLPQTGRIIIKVKDPTNPTYFSEEITMNLKAEATSNTSSEVTTKTASFRIVPTPTKYRVYFKPVNWPKNWDNIHVYAYQPLEIHDPVKNVDVAIMETDRKVDWIEYAFTGNLTFKGWIPYGGTIDPTASGISNTNDWSVEGYLNDYSATNGYGDAKPCYGVWKAGAGAPGDYTNDAVKDKYYTDIELMPGWRTQFDKDKAGNTIGEMVCQNCYKSEWQNTLWPGVAMKKSKTHDGWWYVDLPLLAKPDKTYLMFIDVKGDNHGQCRGDDKDGDNVKLRFPFDDVPGVKLPNYPDKEAWYLCDYSNISTIDAGKQTWTNEFTDDKP